MKKKLFLLLLLGSLGLKAQHSKIVLNIQDTNELKVLDKIEDKLLTHLDEIQKKNRECDISLYSIGIYNGWGWNMPLTKTQVQNDAPPKDKIKTNSYSLDIDWNKSLDTAVILGFSRLYYHEFYTMLRGQKYSLGIHCLPLYHIPLANYSVFLSKTEIASIYSILEKEFVSAIYDDTIYNHNKEVSLRTIAFKKSDSLVQMPWDYWVKKVIHAMKNRDNWLTAYRNFRCGKMDCMSRSEADNSIVNLVQVVDTKTMVETYTEFKGIEVAEKWVFDTINKIHDFYGSCLRISRKIISISIVKDIPQGYEPEAGNPWFTVEDMDKMCTNDGGYLYLYKDLINSALF